MTPPDELRALADALADLGLADGATISSVQRKARVDTPTAMRLLAVHAAYRALAAAQQTPQEPNCTCSTAPNSLCRQHHPVAHETPAPRPAEEKTVLCAVCGQPYRADEFICCCSHPSLPPAPRPEDTTP